MAKRSNGSVTVNEIKIDIAKQFKGILEEIGEVGVENVKALSPVGKTGRYRDGWTYKVTDKGRSIVIHNAGDNKTLTWLLELGNRNMSTGGFNPPKPHIKRAYMMTKPEYIARMKEIEIKPE